MRQATLLFATLLVAGWSDITRGQQGAAPLGAEGDPAIQAQIRAVYDAKDETEISQQLGQLKTISEDKAELVRQLAIFVVTAPNKQEFHDLHTLRILHRLELPSSVPIRVLAPYLGSGNDELRGFAREWFEGHDTASNDPLAPANFKDYAEYIGQVLSRDEDIPVAFVEYIFERSPERALLAFYRGSNTRNVVPGLEAISGALKIAREKGVLGRVGAPAPPFDGPAEEILLAEHIISNAIQLRGFDEQFQEAMPKAKEQLAILSRHSDAWVRLYVVEIMRRHPELRREGVLKKLREDGDESVRKIAMSVK